ncbi:hypothetical protein MRX96_029064 [Rhipicephalus microplus]
MRSSAAEDWTASRRMDAVCRHHANRRWKRSREGVCSTISSSRQSSTAWQLLRSLQRGPAIYQPKVAVAISPELALAYLMPSITGFIYVLEMVGRDSVGPFLHCLLVLRLLIHGALVQVVPKHNVFRLEILTEGSPSFLANFLKFRTEIRNLERHHQHLQEIGLNHLKDQLPCMPKNHFHQSLIVDRVYRRLWATQKVSIIAFAIMTGGVGQFTSAALNEHYL